MYMNISYESIHEWESNQKTTQLKSVYFMGYTVNYAK